MPAAASSKAPRRRRAVLMQVARPMGSRDSAFAARARGGTKGQRTYMNALAGIEARAKNADTSVLF